MSSLVFFLAFLWIIRFPTYVGSSITQKPRFSPTSQIQELLGSNASGIRLPFRSTNFPIPHSSLTLVLRNGRSLDPPAVRALLAVAAAFIDEQKDEHGVDTPCDMQPFQYDLGEGVAISISHTPDPLTWGQLGIVLYGLRLYQVTGNRYKQCNFKIHDSGTPDIYTLVRSGSISRSTDSIRKPSSGVVPSGSPNSISRRAFPITPATLMSQRAIFRIPRSELLLVLYERGTVSVQSVEAILLTADSWVDRKISIWGRYAPMDAIFDYETGDRPRTRLIVWSALEMTLTWGQLKTVLDGLWLYLVDRDHYEYTYWEIYDASTHDSSQIGYGTIIEDDKPPMRPAPGANLKNSTSKRALQISSPTIPLPLNTSAPLPTPTRFPVPDSDIVLSIRPTGKHLSPPKLNALLLVAALHLDEDIENFGENTPSRRDDYRFSLEQGVELWLLKVSSGFPAGYLTYGQLRTVVSGLQIYMVLGKRPEAVRFDVLLTGGRRREVVVGRGAVGDFRPREGTAVS